MSRLTDLYLWSQAIKVSESRTTVPLAAASRSHDTASDSKRSVTHGC